MGPGRWPRAAVPSRRRLGRARGLAAGREAGRAPTQSLPPSAAELGKCAGRPARQPEALRGKPVPVAGPPGPPCRHPPSLRAHGAWQAQADSGGIHGTFTEARCARATSDRATPGDGPGTRRGVGQPRAEGTEKVRDSDERILKFGNLQLHGVTCLPLRSARRRRTLRHFLWLLNLEL